MFAPLNNQNEEKYIYFGNSDRTSGSYVIGGYLGYYISNFEMRIESGFRNDHIMTSNGYQYYKNGLEIIPVDFSIIYHHRNSGSKLMPYFGIGTGVYIATWKAAFVTGAFLDNYYQRSPRVPLAKYARDYAVETHILAGFETPLGSRIFLNSEFRYMRVSGEWRIDHGVVQDRMDVNLSGISLKFGLGYKF